MTPDQRFTLLITGLGIVCALIGWVLKTLWSASGAIASAKDAIDENQKAVSMLTESVNRLNTRMAFYEGRQQRGR